jgi:DNA-binding NarL/FixJ family response regulator
VLIVDDQRTVGEALALAVAVEPDLECVGVATSVEDGLAKLAESDPDVVLMDLSMPSVDGIEGTRRVKETRPETSVIVLTGHATGDSLVRAAEAGAAGFLQKDAAFADIVAAVRTPPVAQMLVDPATLSKLRQRHSHVVATNETSTLTPRELVVLQLMGEGLDPRSIAEQLHVSIHTARGYVKNILSKLGVHSQLEAVVAAARSGLLSGFGTPPELPNAR